MSSKQMVRMFRSESEWRALLAEQAQSGESGLAFSRRVGVSHSTLQAWKRRLLARSADFITVTPRDAGGAGGAAMACRVRVPGRHDGTRARLMFLRHAAHRILAYRRPIDMRNYAEHSIMSS